MSKAIDLIGQRFGKLTVIERSENSRGGKTRWLCRCDCGNGKIILGDSLRKGKTSSCGCKYLESNKGRNTTHGQTSTRLFQIWSGAKQRCCFKKSPIYKNYGGRGITVCEEWQEFMPFYEWAMSHGYTDDLTLDRIDVNGNYCPENCRWVDMKTQQNNRRNNRKIIYKGKEYTLAQLAEELKISSATLANRINSGWEENHLGIKPALDNRIRRFL